MFSVNSGQRLAKLSEVYQFWSFEPQGKLIIEFLSSLPKITPSLDDTPLADLQAPREGPFENINPDNAPEDRFMDADNDRLLDIDFMQFISEHERRQSKGLPPDFVGNLCLNRIFTEPWENADLKNALSGLDYLSNLECTRRTALREAAGKLRISEYTWRSVLNDNYEARVWIYSIQQQEEQIEQYYSTLWVDLRIWIMIKELQTEPFYKPNVIAMLNTLFPPVVKELPSTRISEKALHQHRNSFYRYIVSVEKNGKSVLNGFIEKLMRPGTGHTWMDARQNLKDYVALADSMIKQARVVHGISFFKGPPVEHEPMEGKRGSGTTSDLSIPTSLRTSSTPSTQSDFNRFSNKSGECHWSAADYASSIGSSNIGKGSPHIKAKFVSRSRLSGKTALQKPDIQEDIDALFQGLTPSPWYTSPGRLSTGSGRPSFENTTGNARLHSSSFSRPTTPSLEQQKIHRRSTSIPKRISYDFRNALPDTPELPSPQANEKGGYRSALKISGVDGVSVPKRNVSFVEEPKTTELKKKKSTFSLFRWKKKPDNTSDSKSYIAAVHEESSYANVLLQAEMYKERHPTMEPGVPDQTTLKAPERHNLKLRPSLGFLRVRKTRDDPRSVSDSNSERTITDATIPPKEKLRPRRSLNNLFMNRSTSALPIDENEDISEVSNSTSSLFGRRQTIRKARSYSSVKSASSVYSNDGGRNFSSFDASPAPEEDRVITSADIAEPFPFGTFVPPQTPAMVIEDVEETKYLESVRQKVLEKARAERLAKFEASEESKRRFEAARERRRALRDEMDMNVVPKTKKEKKKEEMEKKKIEAEKKKKCEVENKKQEAEKKKMKQITTTHEPTTPSPLKSRILQEFASAYSTSPRSG